MLEAAVPTAAGAVPGVAEDAGGSAPQPRQGAACRSREAASFASSGGNTQQWRVVIITDTAQKAALGLTSGTNVKPSPGRSGMRAQPPWNSIASA